MDDKIKQIVKQTVQKMDGPLDRLHKDLGKLRAGKASPAMLESVKVDYYGTPTPISQVASVNTPDARTIVIQPWEKKGMDSIEKAIINANLGFNPVNDGNIIRISIPPLTEERRKDLVKQVNKEAEAARVALRNIRRDANEDMKKLKKDGVPEDMLKDGETEIQKLTDASIKKIDGIVKAKEDEILIL